MKNIFFTIISSLFFILLTYLDIKKYGSWGGYFFQNTGVFFLAFIFIKLSAFCKNKSDSFFFSLISSELILLLFEVMSVLNFIYLCFMKTGASEWRIIDSLYSIESSYFFIPGWFLLCLCFSLKRAIKSKKMIDIFFDLPGKSQ